MEHFTPQDFEIYDMHAHIFPDKISEKATLSIGKFYDIGMAYSIGDPEHLLKALPHRVLPLRFRSPAYRSAGS